MTCPLSSSPGDRLVDGTGKPWTVRDVRPQIDADTYDLVDNDGAPGYADIPRPDRWKAITEQDDPTDPPAGTSPAGTPSTTAIPTQGDPVSSPVSFELRNLVSVEDLARHIDSMSEGSDFILVAEKAAVMGDKLRGGGFGREMDTAVDGLEEAARRFAADVTDLRQSAADWAGTAASVRGA
jgi:hypothetical protein